MQMFMSSKLDKATLAKVWSLCDMNTTGTLNSEQFALAMHLISRKVGLASNYIGTYVLRSKELMFLMRLSHK